MNIKRIISFLKLREQLSEDELAMAGVLAGLTENERDLLVESLQPQKPAAKKRKPRGKSARATALSETLSDKLKRRGASCTHVTDGSGSTCGDLEASAIHDPNGGYTGYHPFSPPAHPAVASSSARSGAGGSIASTEDGTVAVGTVAGGSSDGD